MFWNAAARSERLRDDWICDARISDEACVDTVAALLATRVDLDSPVGLIDLGCGIGRVAVPVADRYPNVTVLGVDSSAGMLARAGTHPRVGYVLGDGRSIPATGDAVYSLLMFQHIPTDGKLVYLNECRRAAPILVCQFIEGDEAEPFSHHMSADLMLAACAELGYARTRMWRGLVHPRWTWLVAG